MPKMHNPETGETRDVEGPNVNEMKRAGWVVVGERPEDEYPTGGPPVDEGATPEQPIAPGGERPSTQPVPPPHPEQHEK